MHHRWYFAFCAMRSPALHSVEPPSMRVPQLDMARWGSSWVLHTLCWSAVHCGWGNSLCLPRLPMFALSPYSFLLLRVDPSTNMKCFINVRNIIWMSPLKSMKKIIQVQNVNGGCRTNIDKVGNVFHWSFLWWANITSLKFLRELLITDPLNHAPHFGKKAPWRWSNLNRKFNAMEFDKWWSVFSQCNKPMTDVVTPQCFNRVVENINGICGIYQRESKHLAWILFALWM